MTTRLDGIYATADRFPTEADARHEADLLTRIDRHGWKFHIEMIPPLDHQPPFWIVVIHDNTGAYVGEL